MKNNSQLMLQIYRDPEGMQNLSLSDWDLLIRQARGCNMLARLAWLAEQKELKSSIPAQVVKHLESALQLSEGHERSVKWEINRVCHALKSCDTPVILLKGAAYLIRGFDVGKGRIFNDIDLLVRKEKLRKVESSLLLNGWTTTHHDPYDQMYFREWMHELPPLKHIHRQSVLDVHHTILPVTAYLKPDIKNIFDCIEPVAGLSQVYTLSSVDMVLHSATHLFHEGEFQTGFRGLCDLDGLLRHLSAKSDNFWSELLVRANQLDLQKPLYYALSYSREILNTPVPEDIQRKIAEAAPAGFFKAVMRRLYLYALMPYHHTCDRSFSAAARWMLFVRSHYIKMPLRLLIPHLFRKAFISDKKD
ncbi:nucleotidyltransferase family protein [Deltaproteobacteria bacterium]|nr:nucleotidyltransferase family protein [Deltaproteobacteria bacterium]